MSGYGLDSATTKEWDEASSIVAQIPVIPNHRETFTGNQQPVDYKQSEGKPRYDLIPAEALDEVAEVFTLGAVKYEDHRWRQGIRSGALFAATMRHSWAWWRGEDNDPDTGKSHIAHAISNLMMLLGSIRCETAIIDRPS